MAQHSYDDQYYGVSNDDWRNLIDVADVFTGKSPVPWSSWGWDDVVNSSDPIDYWAFKINCSADITLCVRADDPIKYALYKYEDDALSLIKATSLSKTHAIKYWDDGDWDYEEPSTDYEGSLQKLIEPGLYVISVEPGKENSYRIPYDIYFDELTKFDGGSHNDDEWQAVYGKLNSKFNFGPLENWKSVKLAKTKKDHYDAEEDVNGDFLPDYDKETTDWVGYSDEIAWRTFSRSSGR